MVISTELPAAGEKYGVRKIFERTAGEKHGVHIYPYDPSISRPIRSMNEQSDTNSGRISGFYNLKQKFILRKFFYLKYFLRAGTLVLNRDHGQQIIM